MNLGICAGEGLWACEQQTTQPPRPMNRFTTLTLALTSLSLSALPAQQDADTREQEPQVPQTQNSMDATRPHQEAKVSDPDAFYVPIHTAPDDNGLAYGLWASGPDYKVSFHDGVSYYPVLGSAYPENLPLTWRTQSITMGGVNLRTRAIPTQTHSDWRIELDHGAIVEAYDVQRDGVEQTFVLTQRPANGELIIEGRIESKLTANSTAPAHQALSFTDQSGKAIVGYGAAVAIDANGNRRAMTTAYESGRLQLQLDAQWLATARYPVTVDPLLSTTIVASGAHLAANVSIARDDVANQLFVSYSRISANGDFDLYGRITDDDFNGSTTVFTDITASWKTSWNDVAFVAKARKWVLAMQRNFTTSEGIRVHMHDSNDLSVDTSYKAVVTSSVDGHTRPSIGGTTSLTSGDKALLVWSKNIGTLGNSSNTEILGAMIDATNNTVGLPFIATTAPGVTSGGFDRTREYPNVINASSGGTSSWIVAYQEYNNNIVGDDWDLLAARIEYDGTPVGLSSVGIFTSTKHRVAPQVAGRDGRYLVAYSTRANNGFASSSPWGNEIRVQRFDWDESSALPTKLSGSLIRSDLVKTMRAGGVGFDNLTDSHFCVTTKNNHGELFADRIGFDAGVTESVSLPTAGHAYTPDCFFDDDHRRFAIVYTDLNGAYPVVGTHLTYKSAKDFLYGTGSGGAILATGPKTGMPYAGSEFYTVRLAGAAPNTPTALWLSLAPAALPLAGMGAPGCFLNVDANQLLVGLSLSTDMSGRASVQLPIPSNIHADLFCQFGYVDIGVNALHLQTTRGLAVEIR